MNKLFNRAIALGEHIPALNPRQRLQVQAETISRAGTLQMHLDAITGALVAFSGILFDTEAGRLVNVDPRTRQILIPAPWGSAGWKTWGLRKWEGGCLREIMFKRVWGGGAMPFDYSEYQRAWYVDSAYNDRESLLRWLHDHGPTLEEWRAALDAYHAKALQRTNKKSASVRAT